MTLVSREVGQVGFVTYLHALRKLGVLSQPEVLGWLGLHGAVIRRSEAPLDDGSGLDEQALAGLLRDLGAAEEIP
jgi:hypothetical protein